MDNLKPGEEVTVEGTVLRTRDGRAEVQLRDGQLLRVPVANVARAASPAGEKAVKEAPEHKAVTVAPENKSARRAASRGEGTGHPASEHR